MRILSGARLAAVLMTLPLMLATVPAVAEPPARDGHHHGDGTVRFATFNASLNRAVAGELVRTCRRRTTRRPPRSRRSSSVNARRAAGQRVRLRARPRGRRPVPQQLPRGLPARRGARSTTPTSTSRRPTPACPSGHDLNNDGTVGGGNDAFGFGLFEGQYGMAVFSRYPIDNRKVRTFQNFRWADMPGALLPDDPATAAPADWYSPEELEDVRLSSKSHWDVPIRVGATDDRALPRLAPDPSHLRRRRGPQRHPQPRRDPVLGRLRLGGRSRTSTTTRGRRGGLARGAPFVVAGDQNSDPVDGDSVPGAIQQLIGHPRIDDPLPTSAGAVEAAALQGGANLTHEGDPALRHRRLLRHPSRATCAPTTCCPRAT